LYYKITSVNSLLDMQIVAQSSQPATTILYWMPVEEFKIIVISGMNNPQHEQNYNLLEL